MISLRTVKRLGLAMQEQPMTILMVGKSERKFQYVAKQVPLIVGGVCASMSFYVLDNLNHDALLGRPFEIAFRACFECEGDGSITIAVRGKDENSVIVPLVTKGVIKFGPTSGRRQHGDKSLVEVDQIKQLKKSCFEENLVRKLERKSSSEADQYIKGLTCDVVNNENDRNNERPETSNHKKEPLMPLVDSEKKGLSTGSQTKKKRKKSLSGRYAWRTRRAPTHP